jgi:hypothetical protein
MISHKTFVSLEMMADRARREVVRPEEDKDKWYWLSHPGGVLPAQPGLQVREAVRCQHVPAHH